MALAPDLVIVPLGDGHDRAGFTCGVESLDRYFQTQAGQDVRRRANGVFVLAGKADPARVLGYDTLCATALAQGDCRRWHARSSRAIRWSAPR